MKYFKFSLFYKTRTAFLLLLFVVFGIALMSVANLQQNIMYSTWVHGHSATLEDRISKSSKFAGISKVNDAVDWLSHTRFQTHRVGWGLQCYYFDSGKDNRRKSGETWIHYAIPTPVITNNKRVKLNDILINLFGSTEKLHIAAIHVWDGNKRIAKYDNIKEWGKKKLIRYSIPNTPSVAYGIGISILIKGDEVTAENKIEICGVGADFIL